MDGAEISAGLKRLYALPRAALAVSGGSDSMALMELTAAHIAQLGRDLSNFTILSVDHGLRSGSAREAAMVADRARALGFAHVTLTWEGAKPRAGLQEAARFARLDLMSAWCVANRVGHLVLGHTLDDQAETFVMRVARGSGPNGLGAMDEVGNWYGITLLRPLLDVPREQLKAWLEARGIGWISDPSNDDPRFTRVRVRQLLPALEAAGVGRKALAMAADQMRAARNMLERAADAAAGRALTLHDGGICTIALDIINVEPADIARRLLRRAVMAIGAGRYPPERAEIARLADWLSDGAKTGRTLGGCAMTRIGDNVVMFREFGRSGLETRTLRAGARGIWDRRFHVEIPSEINAKIRVRALGSDGLKALPDGMVRPRGLPAAALHTLPSFWQGDALLTAPHLNEDNGVDGARFTAWFVNAERIRLGAGAVPPERLEK